MYVWLVDGKQPRTAVDSSLPLKVKDELLELSKDISTIQAGRHFLNR